MPRACRRSPEPSVSRLSTPSASSSCHRFEAHCCDTLYLSSSIHVVNERRKTETAASSSTLSVASTTLFCPAMPITWRCDAELMTGRDFWLNVEVRRWLLRRRLHTMHFTRKQRRIRVPIATGRMIFESLSRSRISSFDGEVTASSTFDLSLSSPCSRII